MILGISVVVFSSSAKAVVKRALSFEFALYDSYTKNQSAIYAHRGGFG